MLEQSLGEKPPAPPPEARAVRRRARADAHLEWFAIAVITLGAGVLRLYHIGRVPLDPFYDSAVRSMTLSLHNFFFGAMEPSGSVSIDKPPVDMWLQVVSVKLVGFSTTGLMLPEALFGTAAVPLLFAAVRRIFGTLAGLASALVLALLPIEVITSRSDTMDAVMMALIVLALLLIARASSDGSTTYLLLAAGALGLAFDVKLTESLVALPGLVVFAFFALPGSVGRRALKLLAAGAVYALVALAWLLATLAFPASERPFAYGSTNGSAWNAALVYNGIDRLEGKATPGQNERISESPGTPRPSEYARLTQTERDHIPLRPPSAGRLLDRAGPLSGERLGLLVLAALLFGLPALAFELRERKRRRAGPAARGGRVQRDEPARNGADAARADAAERARRVRIAALSGLLLWVILATALFSSMTHLHPRYTEAMTPAVAATLGAGLAWTTAERTRARLAVLAVALAVLVIYAEQLLFGATALWWITLLAALAALAAAATARGELRAGALALALASVLAIPTWASLRAVKNLVSDTNQLGYIAPRELAALSGYLRAHQGSAYYEVAYDSASKMGSLVVRDARPVLVLNTVQAQVVTPLARLRALAAAGKVRYAALNYLCGPGTPRGSADCSATARWVAAHGRNVSREAGLTGEPILLYRLPRR